MISSLLTVRESRSAILAYLILPPNDGQVATYATVPRSAPLARRFVSRGAASARCWTFVGSTRTRERPGARAAGGALLSRRRFTRGVVAAAAAARCCRGGARAESPPANSGPDVVTAA